MKNNYEEVLVRLIEYRENNKFSKTEMAKKLDVDRSLYSRIESGSRIITNNILLKMYELGIDIDYLVTGIKTEKTQLNILLEKCKIDRRASYINIIVSYINIFISNNDKKLSCKREMEILKHNIDVMNGHCIETVWACLRRIHGIKQTKMIELLGINEKTYRNIEHGITMPDLDVFITIYNEYNYFPTLLLENNPNYLLMINSVWSRLPENNREQLTKIFIRTFKEINKLQV